MYIKPSSFLSSAGNKFIIISSKITAPETSTTKPHQNEISPTSLSNLHPCSSHNPSLHPPSTVCLPLRRPHRMDKRLQRHRAVPQCALASDSQPRQRPRLPHRSRLPKRYKLHTNYAKASYSVLTHNISVYANWANYAPSNISIDGIFFDEVNSTSVTSVLTYMHNASSYAYATVPSDITPVIFNTGVNPPSQFFSWADTILDYENSYANYENYTTIKNIPNHSQSAIVLHDVPENAPIKSLVHTMAYYGIEATWLTHDCCYNAIDTTILNALVPAVQAG